MCVVLRHEKVIRHCLRYDPRIVIGPDWDFFIRFADLGTFGYLANRTGYYRVHRSNITATVDSTRRAGYLAICRENAIKMASFATCTTATRAAVFYDLLINLLRSQNGPRKGVTRWPEFTALPAVERARLMRLIAVDALLRDHEDVSEWLQIARLLNPADRRARVLATLYGVSPRLCRLLLQAASPSYTRALSAGPFADLETARLSASAVSAPGSRGES
jgi:hypothetical protein